MNKRPENAPASKLYLTDLADHLFPVPRKNQTSERERSAGARSLTAEHKPALHLGEARKE